MKILITTDLYKPSVNGVVTSVTNLATELSKLGYEVRILTISNKLSSYKTDNVYYIRSVSLKIYPDVRMPVSYSNKYIDELIDWNPDIIHSNCEFFSFQFAKHIATKADSPLIHTYHTLYEQYAGYLIHSKRLSDKMIAILSRERLRLVDVIIAPTAKVRDSLISYKLKNEIVVIPTGIEIGKYQHESTRNSIPALRKKLAIPDKNQILVSVGRLGIEKNIEELLYNVSLLLKERTDITFLIVGDGPAKKELETITSSLDISDNVIFTGMVSPDEVSLYYSLGDIFICASTSETQGLTYIEAVANGLPLVCRKDSCLENVIIDGLNGYQYTTPKEFVTYINKILNDPIWTNNVSTYDDKVIASFSKESFAKSIDALYNRVSY